MKLYPLKSFRAVDALILLFLFALTFFYMAIEGTGGGPDWDS